MNIKQVIATVNRMQADGVIESYALGGAVGATFYLEPVSTFDVDIFVSFRREPGSAIITLQPIFDYLKASGGIMRGEHAILAGWPVQFLPPTDSLVEEALRDAVERDMEGTPARVFTAEHLSAIALKVGRIKDKLRLGQFLEARALDEIRFSAILERHGLLERWDQFKKQQTG